jgi:multiple sugar transport system substrate-binding protein
MKSGQAGLRMLALAGIAVLTFGLTVASPGFAAGKSTIEYAVWGQPYELVMEKAYLEVFAKKYPDINVNLTTAPFDDLHDKLVVRAAGGNLPDVFVLSELGITEFLSKGVLKDLTSLFQRDKVPVNNFLQPALAYVTSDGKPHAIRRVSGSYYGLPTWNSPNTISYNVDAFKAAGVTYNENWDWDQYRATLKKLTKADGSQYGGPLFTGLGGAIPWAFVYGNGGTWVNATAEESVVNSPQTVGAYQFLVDLALKDKSTPTTETIAGLTYTQQFTDGKVATIWSHPWGLAAFKDAKFNWDVGLPPLRNGKRIVEFETCSIVMSKTTNNVEPAWTLIKFLGMDPDCLKIMTDDGVLPSTRDAVINDPKMKKFQHAMEFGVAPDFIAQYNQMDSIIESGLQSALLGQKSVQAAMDDAKQQIDPLLK